MYRCSDGSPGDPIAEEEEATESQVSEDAVAALKELVGSLQNLT